MREMLAAVVGHDGELSVGSVPAPVLRSGEVLLQVRASALNRADLAQRAGHYPPPPGESEILGLEAAGVVVALGPAVAADAMPAGIALGSPACALLAGGGYAELVAVPAPMLMPVPASWSWAEAAALPEAALTAYLNLFMEAGLEAGETALIHAGASGVGTAAILQAKLAGCTVVATAGGPEKVAWCRRLGADLAIDRHQENFAAALKAAGLRADVVLDPVGQAYLEDDLTVLNTGGRIVFIATLSGHRAELDIRQLMRRRARISGSTLRNRPLGEKVRIKQAFLGRFGPDLESGALKPLIDSSFALSEAAAAHDRMAANLNSGKIVLEVRPDASGAPFGRER